MSLSEKLLQPAVRPAVAKDLAATIDSEVSGKKGLSGAAIKTAYAGAKKKVDVPSALSDNLDQIVAIFDPYWDAFGGQGDFGAYLKGRGDEVSADILKIADAHANSTSRDQIAKVYGTFRGKAADMIKDALPAIGATLQKHAA